MKKLIPLLAALSLLLAACRPAAAPTPAGPIRVLALESFLADIAQNIAGDRLTVQSLIPTGLDPHAFEPTPQDAARIAESDLVIANGAGFEEWSEEILQNAGGQRTLVEASAGLTPRQPGPGETLDEDHAQGDPHFWLDPLNVVTYVENIRAGLSAADPAGAPVYAANAAAYTRRLQELDAALLAQIETIPPERRLLVTNHESFGYFADRYGFRIIGTVIPSVSSMAAPSAQELARLVDAIRENGAPAIFLETATDPRLAEQIAAESGAKVVSGLYTHSLTAADGEAPTYIQMMRSNVERIVAALR